MQMKGIAYLALRVLAIYFFMMAWRQFVMILEFLPSYIFIPEINMNLMEVILLVGVPALINFTASILLWIYAKRLSGYFLLKQQEQEEPFNLAYKGIEGFVLSVVGIIFIITSFSAMIRELLYYLNHMNMPIYGRTQVYGLVELAIQFILGVLLVLRSNGIATILRRIREAGLKHLKEEKD